MHKIILLLIFLLIYDNQLHTKHPVETPQQKVQVDIRVTRLEAFFQSYHSSFSSLSGVFIQEADKNGIDWKLLPSIACVESSCGKNYQRNAFGWGSDSLDFGSDSDDITGVAQKIASLSYYTPYRKSGRLYDFALAYNNAHADEYVQKLEYFYEKL
jgi:hypothetical protein